MPHPTPTSGIRGGLENQVSQKTKIPDPLGQFCLENHRQPQGRAHKVQAPSQNVLILGVETRKISDPLGHCLAPKPLLIPWCAPLIPEVGVWGITLTPAY